MHRLAQISISNFRSCKRVDLVSPGQVLYRNELPVSLSIQTWLGGAIHPRFGALSARAKTNSNLGLFP
jgi:hypothetical protein